MQDDCTARRDIQHKLTQTFTSRRDVISLMSNSAMPAQIGRIRVHHHFSLRVHLYFDKVLLETLGRVEVEYEQK